MKKTNLAILAVLAGVFLFGRKLPARPECSRPAINEAGPSPQ